MENPRFEEENSSPTPNTFRRILATLCLAPYALLGWLRFSQGLAYRGYLDALALWPGPQYVILSGLAIGIGFSLLILVLLLRARFAPPLGLFRGFSLKKDAQGHGSVDVKRGGVFPITQGAKALALRHGLEQTGTLERLRALAGGDILPRTLAEGLCEACAFLQTLRMRAQARALSQGETPNNAIRPGELTKNEAERLRAAFKLVAELQDLLSGAFALHLLG